LNTLLQAFKRRYFGLCLIIFNEHCSTKKERLFIELKAGILKFIFLRNSGQDNLPLINLLIKAISLYNHLEANDSKLNSIAMISKETSI